MKWAEELLYELIDIEDAVSAYENSYYDTHDLDYIEQNLEEYQNKLEFYKKELPNSNDWFCNYKVVDGELVNKY